MNSLAGVLLVMAAVVVVGCGVWGAVVALRERRAARRFAERVEAALPVVPTGLDVDLLRVRAALAELRHDVERWERGERT